ncbi:MAG: hypothetical protein WDW38_010881 [Sanguina aurantia]
MSLNGRPVRERNAVDYTGIGHAATPGWLKGNLGRPKPAFIEPLAIRYDDDVQAPVPDKGTKRRQSPNDKAPAVPAKARPTTAEAAAPAKAPGQDAPNTNSVPPAAAPQHASKVSKQQSRADAHRRGKSAPEPPQLDKEVPAAAPPRRRASNEAPPTVPASAPSAAAAAAAAQVSDKKKKRTEANKASPPTAATVKETVVAKRRKTTGSSEAALVAPPAAETRAGKVAAVTAAATTTATPPSVGARAAAATASTAQVHVADDAAAPSQRFSRHRGATAAGGSDAAPAAGKVVSPKPINTSTAPAAKQSTTQQAAGLAEGKDAPPAQPGRQKAFSAKEAAVPSTQASQEPARKALFAKAPAASITAASQPLTGGGRTQMPGQTSAPTGTVKDVANTAAAAAAVTAAATTAATKSSASAAAAAATAAAAVAAAAATATAAGVVTTGAAAAAAAAAAASSAAAAPYVTHQPAPALASSAARAPAHAAQAVASGSGAGVVRRLQASSMVLAGASHAIGGALAARTEGRAFLALQGQYKELQEQYVALKAQKVVELEELVAGHDVHVEEMTGAAKRLAGLWHKQTLAQMALVQAGTSQDVAAKMQQLQGEVLALKESGADSELRLLQQTHTSTQLQAQLQEVRVALANALRPAGPAPPSSSSGSRPPTSSTALQQARTHTATAATAPPTVTPPSGSALPPTMNSPHTAGQQASPETGSSSAAATAAATAATAAAIAAAAAAVAIVAAAAAPQAGTPAALRALLVATKLQSSAINRLAPSALNLLPSSTSSSAAAAATVSATPHKQNRTASDQTGTPLTQQSLGLQRTLEEMQKAIANIHIMPPSHQAGSDEQQQGSAASTPSFGLNRVIADMQLAVSNAAANVHAMVGTPESEQRARDLDSPVEGWRQGSGVLLAVTGLPALPLQQHQQTGQLSDGGAARPGGAAPIGFTTSATFVELNPQESARKAKLSAADKQAARGSEPAQASGGDKLPLQPAATDNPPPPPASIPTLSSQAEQANTLPGTVQLHLQSRAAAAAALPLPLSPSQGTAPPQQQQPFPEDPQSVISTSPAPLQSPAKRSATQMGQLGAPASPTTAAVTVATTAHDAPHTRLATAPVPRSSQGAPAAAAVGPLCTRTPPRKPAQSAIAPAAQLAQAVASSGTAGLGSPIISNQDSCSGPHDGSLPGGGLAAGDGTRSGLNGGARTPIAAQPRAGKQGLFPGSILPGSSPRTAPRLPLPPGSAKRSSTPGAMTPGTATINSGLQKLLGWMCQPVPSKPQTFRWTHSATAFAFEVGPATMDQDPEELQEVFQAFDGELCEGQSQGGAAAGQWLEYQLVSCGSARLEPFLQAHAQGAFTSDEI